MRVDKSHGTAGPNPGAAGGSSGKNLQGRSWLILVVDDDPKTYNAIRLNLPKDYEIIGSASGEESLEMMEAYQPDLIILDSHLPGQDGFKLCRELRRRTDPRHIPVIFLTVRPEGVRPLKSLKIEGSAYLMKPLDPRKLLGTIERLLDQAPL